MVMAFATGIMSSHFCPLSAQAAGPRRKRPATHSCLALSIPTPLRLVSSLRGHQIRVALLVGVAIAERELARRVPLHLDPQVLLQVLPELCRGRFIPAVKLQLPRVAREEPERYA